MFQKTSFSIPSDTSGILLVKIIQTRRCSSLRHAKIGKFLKTVNRELIPNLIRFKKKKSRALTVRTSHHYVIKKGFSYNFIDNGLVLLKKRMNTRGKEILGPTSKKLKIKKFLVAFKDIF